MQAPHRTIRKFLSSPEATASAFSSIGWDIERAHGDHAFWCLATYGILEEMELCLVTHADGSWYAEMYIPPVLAKCERTAEDLCAALCRDYPPLVATVDVDRAVLVGMTAMGDILEGLRTLWRLFAEDVVYQTVLTLAGMTAPTEDDVGFDVPDNPFDD